MCHPHENTSRAHGSAKSPAGTIADALQRVLADRAAAIARRAVELVEEHARRGPLRDEVAVLVLRQTER
jgi:hypothetical protein